MHELDHCACKFVVTHLHCSSNQQTDAIAWRTHPAWTPGCIVYFFRQVGVALSVNTPVSKYKLKADRTCKKANVTPPSMPERSRRKNWKTAPSGVAAYIIPHFRGQYLHNPCLCQVERTIRHSSRYSSVSCLLTNADSSEHCLARQNATNVRTDSLNRVPKLKSCSADSGMKAPEAGGPVVRNSCTRVVFRDRMRVSFR